MSRKTTKAILYITGSNISFAFLDLKQFTYQVSSNESESIIFPMDHCTPVAKDLFSEAGHSALYQAVERIMVQNKVCVNVTRLTQTRRMPVNGEAYAEYDIVYNEL